jgi:transposase-like protein
MATVQLCTVHLTRNVLSKVKPSDKDQIAQELRDVLDPSNPADKPEIGHQRFINFIQNIYGINTFKTFYWQVSF